MPISLHAATVPSFQQLLQALDGLLVKAAAFCQSGAMAPESLIQCRLAPDMLPFAYQVKSAVVHSAGAIEGVRRGSFSPDTSVPPPSIDALRARLAEGLALLGAVSEAELEALIGREMFFVFGERRIAYRAEQFLLSFSVPNFYFHVTTAYDILRWQGIAIGKVDYLGRTRRER